MFNFNLGPRQLALRMCLCPVQRFPPPPSCSPEQKSWFVVFYQQLAKLGTTGSTSQLVGGPIMPDLVPRTPAEDRWSAERYVEVRKNLEKNFCFGIQIHIH